jgi:hypothetical protein
MSKRSSQTAFLVSIARLTAMVVWFRAISEQFSGDCADNSSLITS